jgi:hypothetical protein
MPFVIYSVYGRKHFYKYFTAQLVFSLICFLIYIIAPTQAKLQHDEVVVNKIYESKNFFDKMVFKTYQSAAPYGEIPSGH